MSPLFAYLCPKCLKGYEMMVPLEKTDKPVKCPKCKKKMRKIITPPNFRIN